MNLNKLSKAYIIHNSITFIGIIVCAQYCNESYTIITQPGPGPHYHSLSPPTIMSGGPG